MTLIELMVVIAILVTLVAGVLPLVSPNNDARKIADAARSLQTYFMQAQAEAQRLGRPVGVGFRESAPGSGVALEVFQLAVPKPFAGLDPNARVRILFPVGNYGYLGADPQGGTQFSSRYEGELIYRLQFVKGPIYLNGSNAPDYPPDPYPDRMFKIGDVINLEGNEFLIVDDAANETKIKQSSSYQSDDQDFNRWDGFLYDPRRGEVDCIWINNFGQQPPKFKNSDPDVPSGPGDVRTYRVHRQPATGDKFAPSSESAYQLPTGIAIDLQASGVEGLGPPETFAEVWEGQNPPNPPYQKQIGIMFSPQGGIDGVWVNDRAVNLGSTARSGNKLTSVARVFLMLGRVENQNPSSDLYDFDVRGANMSDDELRTIRSRVNWLNPDSRWLMINAQNGRLEVVQSAMFDPRNSTFLNAFQNEVQTLKSQVTSSLAPGELQLHGGTEGVLAEARKTLLIEAAHGDAHGHQ
jgi:type II secretory pathway pseudopilin PulG